MIGMVRAHGSHLRRYMAPRLPYPPDFDGVGAALLGDDGSIRAAWLFEPGRYGAIELHVAADDPYWTMRGNLRAMFRQGFGELGAKRIMTGIGEHNTRSFRLARWFGFNPVGLLPDYYVTGEGAWIMDMRKKDCRWLGDDDG